MTKDGKKIRTFADVEKLPYGEQKFYTWCLICHEGFSEDDTEEEMKEKMEWEMFDKRTDELHKHFRKHSKNDLLGYIASLDELIEMHGGDDW